MKKFLHSLFTNASGRLVHQLHRFDRLLQTHSISDLNKEYLRIYSIYSHLPLREQQAAAPAMNELRERIEDQLLAEKEVVRLLQQGMKGNMNQRRARYHKIHDAFVRLPRNVQREYYPQLVHLRQDLEGAR